MGFGGFTSAGTTPGGAFGGSVMDGVLSFSGTLAASSQGNATIYSTWTLSYAGLAGGIGSLGSGSLGGGSTTSQWLPFSKKDLATYYSSRHNNAIGTANSLGAEFERIFADYLTSIGSPIVQNANPAVRFGSPLNGPNSRNTELISLGLRLGLQMHLQSHNLYLIVIG